MLNFKKDRVLLLKALRNLVTENMEAATLNPFLDQEVSDYMTEVTDKRRARKLKMVRRELDKMIDEMVAERKLREQERLYNEARLKQTNEAYAAHCNADQ